MNKSQRITYHRDLWPAACEAQRWDARDQDKRRDVALACMEAVRGPMVTTSHANFGDEEITALFTYLRHLAEPDNISLSMSWDNCRADYRAFNMSRQADYHQDRAQGAPRYYRGRKTAARDPVEAPLNRKEATHRLIRMRASSRKMTLNPDKKFVRQPESDLIPF